MGLFNKKKKIPEPEIPGFAETEKNKFLVSDKLISNIASENNLNFSSSFNDESINSKKDDDDLKYQEENDDWSDVNYGNNEEEYEDIGELPEIPGIEEIRKQKEIEKEKKIIPDVEKKISIIDVKDTKKNNLKAKKLKSEEENENIELNISSGLKNESKMKKSIIDDSDKSIFVKIEDFNSVNLAINEIKNKILLIKKNIDQINQIKEKEDEEIKNWERELVLIKEKLAYVDEILKTKAEK